MEAAVLSENELLDRYVTELTKLSHDARLELIARLSQTLKSIVPETITPNPAPEPRKTLLDFAGIWANDPDAAEKMIADIHSSRTFTRPEISFE